MQQVIRLIISFYVCGSDRRKDRVTQTGKIIIFFSCVPACMHAFDEVVVMAALCGSLTDWTYYTTIMCSSISQVLLTNSFILLIISVILSCNLVSVHSTDAIKLHFFPVPKQLNQVYLE